jgi:tetratricopeptide (TPR) repeat protein
MAQKNILVRSKQTKAEALFRDNRLPEAKQLYASLAQTNRTDPSVWLMLGIINRKLGLFAESEECCRRAVTLQPGLAAAQQALGAALQCRGRMEEALAAYRTAIRLDPALAEAHYLLGNALKDLGLIKEAIEHYRKAIAVRPNFLEALSNLGLVLMTQGQTEETVDCLNRALQLKPASPQVLCNLAAVLEREGRFDEARQRLERALHHAPDFVDAIAKLAELDEKTIRLEQAKRWLEKGLSLAPDNVSLLTTASKIARSEGRFQDAIEVLEKIRTLTQNPAAVGDVCMNLGKLYDRVGDTERAFACFVEGNRLTAQISLPADYDRQSYLRRIDHLSGFLTDGLADSWANATDPAPTPAPVFLLGFPRSGTTLLDQILDSHPKLQTMEEKPTVAAMVQEFARLADGRADALAVLNIEEIGGLRKSYFDAVRQHIQLRPGNILVDKLPLNTVNTHLIWRVFPNAKFILAVRHPCDVCLSCFMQNFTLNEAMATFYSLDSTAALYAKVMGLWQQCVQKLPIKYHQIRYEDLVSNFEHETRRLLDFLEVGWDDAVLQHTEHARKRGTINTPSYHQVTQPIYQHAKYRWKRYAKQLEPVMETLRPYIEYFGYEEERNNPESSK